MDFKGIIPTDMSGAITIILFVEYSRGMSASNLRSLAETYYSGDEGKGMVVIGIIYTLLFASLRVFIKWAGGI
jgi:hypothetical protein